MNDSVSGNEIVEREMTADAGMVALLNKSEIDMQISTAHKFPRSITKFRKEVFEMVTISEAVADECFYALPRKEPNGQTKMIEGPSARFGEIVASAWGNCRAGARVVDDSGDFVTAQGVFHDLERNVAITYEVKRRIVGSNGRRYSVDMIGVTGNAAASIALRNAILKGVPKAFWSAMYEDARRTAIGDVKTLPTRRATVMEALRKLGATEAQVFAKLNIGGADDIGLDEIAALKGMITAIKDGDTTVEQAFAVESNEGPTTPAKAAPKSKSEARPTPPPADPEPPFIPDQPAAKPTPPAKVVPPTEGGLTAEEEARWQAEMQASTNETLERTAAKTLASASPADSGELASVGEQQWLAKRAGANLQALLAKHGVASLEVMTRVQFDTLRAEVV